MNERPLDMTDEEFEALLTWRDTELKDAAEAAQIGEHCRQAMKSAKERTAYMDKVLLETNE